MNRTSTLAPVLTVVALFAAEAALGPAVEAQALSLTPASQNFGSVVPGVTSAVVAFTVINRGTSPTKALSVGVGGNDALSFAIAANSCGAALSPGGTCTVSVSFSPRSVGGKAASLDIKAGPGSMIRSSLSGTGNSGMLSCPTGQTMQNGVCGFPPAGATTTACPAGYVANGTGGCTMMQTTTCPTGYVANATGGCTMMQATSCGTGQTMQNGVCVYLAAGTTATGCPSGVANGTGGCTGSTLSVGPISRDFGSVRSGKASPVFTFTVVNVSTSSLSVSVVLSGVNASSFAIASNTCAGLPPGGSCTVGVRFIPTTVMVNTASLYVTATGGSAQASLMGTATP